MNLHERDPSMEVLAASGARTEATDRLFVKSGVGFAAGRVRRQAEWILEQKPWVASHFPIILSVQSDRMSTIVTMLRSELAPLDDMLIGGLISVASTTRLLTTVLDWVEGSMHSDQEAPWTLASDYLVERVLRRLKSIPPEYCPVVDALIHNDLVPINGIEVPGALAAIQLAQHELTALDLDSSNKTTFCNVHGDLHLGNILTNGMSFKLIDPRGGFDAGRTSFDPSYDFGKLFHDVECGYSLIKRGLVYVTYDGLSCELVTSSPAAVSIFQTVAQALTSRLGGDDSVSCRKAHIYGALLLAGAVPFHLRFHNRVMAMLVASLVRLSGFNPLPFCAHVKSPT
jgi:hypothetical protein